MRALAAALIAGATGCGLFVGVDWDKVQVKSGVVGYLPDGAPIYAPDVGDPNQNPSGSCPPPQVECLTGCCPPNDDPGKPAHIAAGQTNTCAVTTSGQVRCWGSNGNGQLGIGVGTGVPTLTTNRPVAALRIPRGASAVAVGTGHVCAIVDGALACWGSNAAGELGIASTAEGRLPALVTTQDKPTFIAAGQSDTCAILGSGAWCWGTNNADQIAYDDPQKPVTTPRAIGQLSSGVTAIAIAMRHACAVQNGAVSCWGLNDGGDLGSQATLTPVPTPTGITAGATALALGYDHSCAIVSGGVRCWGSNLLGALGNDGVQVGSTDPVTPTGLDTGVRSICAGFEFTCAVVNGGVSCFGTNKEGELGIDLAYTYKRTPTPVDGLASGVAEVACGYMHACALKDDGTILCWGKNDSGQLGNSTNDDSAKAVTVTWP